MQDCVLLPGFCANGGFGNHLTSVTSCYVSPSRRDRGGDRGGDGEQQSERQKWKERGNQGAAHVLPKLRGMLHKSLLIISCF